MASCVPVRRLLRAILQTTLKALLSLTKSFEDYDKNEALNPKTLVHWSREAWRGDWQRVKKQSFRDALPSFLLLCCTPFLFAVLWLVIFVLYVTFNFLGLGYCIKGIAAYWERVEERKDEAAFRDRFCQPATQAIREKQALGPPSTISRLLGRGTGPFFQLPPEIRQDILIIAFGGRTLHMGLEFQRPFFAPNFYRYSDPNLDFHAKIHHVKGFEYSHLDSTKPKQWVSFGCICHRSPYRDLGGLRSHGAFRYTEPERHGSTSPWQKPNNICEPKDDRCIQGISLCETWPGNWPDKCQIGIMGWLLTCRQAYLEGFDVLYRTNTIQIASATLHRNMHNILSLAVLSHLTSLELVWDLDSVPIPEALSNAMRKKDQEFPSPIFPSMASLRLAFSGQSVSALCIGLRGQSIRAWEIKFALISRLFPMIDNFLDRSVPSTADVTISCPTWAWYAAVDLTIINEQGEELSRPQHADIGGVKFWRQAPPRETNSDTPTLPSIEEGVRLSGDRQGFWVHSSDRPATTDDTDAHRRVSLYDKALHTREHVEANPGSQDIVLD